MGALGQKRADRPAIGIRRIRPPAPEIEQGGQIEIRRRYDEVAKPGDGGGEVERVGLIGVVEDLSLDLRLEAFEQLRRGDVGRLSPENAEGVVQPFGISAVGEQEDLRVGGFPVGNALDAGAQNPLLGGGLADVDDEDRLRLVGRGGGHGGYHQCNDERQRDPKPVYHG